MKIKKVLSELGNDFEAIYVCEHCGEEQQNYGYSDANFYQNVIPNMSCPKCGKKRNGEEEIISDCCSSGFVGEIVDGYGRCKKCKEMAKAVNPEQQGGETKKPMMKCGCSANAINGKGETCRVIHGCEEVIEAPKLKGRFARCTYYGKIKPRRRFANDECNYGCCGKEKCECGRIPSNMNLAFFQYKPNEEYDEFYCGCFGWD